MNKKEKEQMIQEAAKQVFDAGVPGEIWETAVFLQRIGHEYGRDWSFCFCVCVEVGHLEAQAEGYIDMWDRAGKRMQALMELPNDA